MESCITNIATTVRHVEPTKTTDSLFCPLTKNAERREKFRKLGKAISAIRDYYTGEDCQFEIKSRAVQDRDLSSILFGPRMKTQQFERTVKHD